MRERLALMDPAWLSSGVSRGRMGFDFLCPVCATPHRLEVWFLHPVDGDSPVTATEARPLHDREGETFEALSIYPPLRHGDSLLFIYEGELVVG